FWMGQVNTLVVFLLTFCVLYAAERPAWAGAALAVAIVAKTSPVIFLLYLLTSRRWGVALWTVGRAGRADLSQRCPAGLAAAGRFRERQHTAHWHTGGRGRQPRAGAPVNQFRRAGGAGSLDSTRDRRSAHPV